MNGTLLHGPVLTPTHGVGFLMIHGRVEGEAAEVAAMIWIASTTANWVFLGPKWQVSNADANEMSRRRGPMNWHAVRC